MQVVQSTTMVRCASCKLYYLSTYRYLVVMTICFVEDDQGHVEVLRLISGARAFSREKKNNRLFFMFFRKLVTCLSC